MIQSWNERLGFVAPYTRSRARLRYSDRHNPLHDLALKLVVLTSSSATSGSDRSKSTRAESNHSHCGSSTLHLRQSPSWFLDSQASVVVVVELVLRPAAQLLSSSASRSYSTPVSLVVVASSLAAIGIVRIYSSVKLVSSNGDSQYFANQYRVPPAVLPRQACYESQCMSQQLIAMCEARGFKVPVHMPHPPLSIYMSLYQRAYELRFFPNK
ncbi:hypothetical protein Bca4012_093142 [Brassica carinata]